MDLQTLSNGFADAVESVARSVVRVNGRSRQSASGIVWRDQLIVTANHVVEREDKLSITTPDGTEHQAEILGRDPIHDIAVLRVKANGLIPAAFADTEPRVGQLVLAVGRPGEDGPQASLGLINIVGGPVRTRRGTINQYLRTDATPYPGFSGGPLITPAGEVVGLFTSGLAGGEPVAIPVAVLQHVADHLLNHGRVRRGFLGISSQTINLPANQRAGRTQEQGLLIVRVEEQSPAAHGGLLVGDIVVGLDGQAIADPSELQDLLSGERVGKSVPIDVIRGDQLQTFKITIGERPS